MLPENAIRPDRYDFREKIFEIGLLFFILYMAYLTLSLSSTRFFDFDEYQVLYESASLVRGKALYGHKIADHFPLVDVMISFLLRHIGFKTASVVAARYFVFLVLLTTLFFIFKITDMIWNRKAGLTAVALTISCVVFARKGIEIRHDVLNSAFNTIGAYCALKFLGRRRIYFIWMSGLFLGLAVASTQKAAIWSIGIILGLSFYLAKEGGFRQVGQVLAIYAITAVLPLLAFFIYLHLATGESLKAFLEVTVIAPFDYFSPEKANRVYPFPYAKTAIYKGLFYENALFYMLSLCGLFRAFKDWARHNSAKVIIAFWGVMGASLYLISSRPFHQTLLPTIPAFGIMAGGLIVESGRRLRFYLKRMSLGFEVFVLLLLLLWPSYLITKQQDSGALMKKEMKNISFCLENLSTHEKVLSLTQQQVFFDSLISLGKNECGSSIYTTDAGCFEQMMIRNKCKVIIFDHRTRYLNNEVKKKIRDNYLHAGVGDILIPGFRLPPGATIHKSIWIEGDYYSPTRSLKVDGRQIRGNWIHFEQKEYAISNSSNRFVLLVYIFKNLTDRNPLQLGQNKFFGDK